jgi:hypothetical protein
MTRPMQLESRYINKQVILPYELTVQEVEEAVAETYRLFHGLKTTSYRAVFGLWRNYSSATRFLELSRSFW